MLVGKWFNIVSVLRVISEQTSHQSNPQYRNTNPVAMGANQVEKVKGTHIKN